MRLVAFLLVFLTATSVSAEPSATLKPFYSEMQLSGYLKKISHRYDHRGGGQIETVVVTGSLPSMSITNNQELGVDEGDIVKLHGNTLVVLRRGRIFTLSLADGGLATVDSIASYPPGVDAREDWYDEMLIDGDRVIVLGYSYGRGGAEINRFHIDAAGHLSFEDAYQLKSDDYYSSRNYATRLIGHRLILYSPRYLYMADDVLEVMPALRRWNGDKKRPFKRMSTARRVYPPPPAVPDDEITSLHTVMSCDVAAPEMTCTATSLFGPDGRTFYVSPRAIYVWVGESYGDCWKRKDRPCLLYRLPLDGGAPSAVGVRGFPTDQLSFREEENGLLHVLVRSEGGGDGMWGPEDSFGTVSLLSIPPQSFGDGTVELSADRYRRLPEPRNAEDYSLANRFVGGYLLYGTGNDWGQPREMKRDLIAAAVDGEAVNVFHLPHGVDRIEAMGPNAVVVGSSAKDVYFSMVQLGTGSPALGDRYVLANAAQAETRSHGFFFRPYAGTDESGDLGLPVTRPASPAYKQLFDETGGVVFLRYNAGKFTELGEVLSHPERAKDDKCVASCVDWYGNSRPIFIGSRTFALMGYEMVDNDASTMQERARLDFAPH